MKSYYLRWKEAQKEIKRLKKELAFWRRLDRFVRKPIRELEEG